MKSKLLQYREMLTITQMKIFILENKLTKKNHEQVGFFLQANRLLDAFPRQLAKVTGISVIQAEEKFQIYTRWKAENYREAARALQCGIHALEKDLRIVMQKKITVEGLLEKETLAAKRMEAQNASNRLLAMDTLRRFGHAKE